MKKFILLLIASFMVIMCLGGIFSLSMFLHYADFQRGKPVVITICVLMIVVFGLLAIKCFKSVFQKKEVKQNYKATDIPATETSTQLATEGLLRHETKSTAPVLEVSIVQQKVPQDILNDMRINYTRQQAANDMRIIDESLAIMESTSDIDTFLSRYETAMRCAATLEQAREAGVPIASSDNFSQSLVEAKNNALAGVLYRSFQKELDEISKLKTDKGKINRINKFQNKLEDMYADVFEFVAEDAYNDVIRKLEHLKNN